MRRWGLIAQLGLMVVLAAVAFPSDGSALLGRLNIALTPSGPSPAVATLTAGGTVPWWTNRDQVTHTIVFANGLCSLRLAPAEDGYCSKTFWFYVGRYPYTVDGTASASVVVTAAPRTVTLTARSHTIRRGAHLLLHGTLSFDCCASAPTGHSGMPVIVLARHDRYHAFQRIALAEQPGSRRASRYPWQLDVHPKTTTIYIAAATAFGEVWRKARSKPFKVIVRARS